MTTLRQIVTDAYRQEGIIQENTVPSASQFDEGFRKLLTIIEQMYGNEVGAPFVPVSVGKNNVTNSFAVELDQKPFIQSYYVKPNLRLMCNLEETLTVFLDPNPVDGSRFAVIDLSGNFSTNSLLVNANGRKISGSTSVLLNTDSTNRQWFYRADLGEWTEVTSLTANSESPFPFEFDDLLSTKVIMRLNPRFLKQSSPETVMEYKELLRKFRAKYKQVEESHSELALSRVHPRNGTFQYSNIDGIRFNQGLIY